MTQSTCFIFELREPLQLNWYWPVEGYRSEKPERLYFNFEEQRKRFERNTLLSYLPANEILSKLVDSGARFAFKLDGSFIDVCEESEDVMASFKDLVSSDGVELLGSPYYSTLSCFFSSFGEFKDIVEAHKKALKNLFNYTPSTFANAGLIFNSRIGHIIKGMGFRQAVIGGEGLRAQFGYRTESGIIALPIHRQLSLDIEARFSDRGWPCYPLNADTYAGWIARMRGELAVIYVDYPALGVTHAKDSGIFKFLASLPKALEKHGVAMITPSGYDGTETEYSDFYDTVSQTPVMSVLGNHMQHLYFNEIKRMEQEVGRCSPAFKNTWRKLQTTDILLDMEATQPWRPWDRAVSNLLLLSDFRRRTIEAME